MKDFVEIDFQMLEYINKLVYAFQKKGVVNNNINPINIAEIIYERRGSFETYYYC